MTLRIHPDEIIAKSKSSLLAAHETWERVRIRDICELQNGGAFRSALFNADGVGIPIIRIRDVGSSHSKTYYSGDYRDDYVVTHGDLVIGMDGDFRVARWSGDTALLNQRVCRLRVRDASLYDEGFLYRVLPGYLNAVHTVTSAVTVKHLSSKTIEQLPIPLPPLAEQKRITQRIARAFGRLDRVQSVLENLRGALELYRYALLADVFYTNRDLPPDWKSMVLGDVARWGSGGTPKRTVSQYYGGDIPWARIGDLKDDTVYDCQIAITDRGLAESSCKVVEPGAILIAMYGSIGKLGIAGTRMTTNQAIAFAVPLINNLYLFYYLLSQRQFLIDVGKGATQKNISQTILKRWPIPVPPLAEQKKVVSLIQDRLSCLVTINDAIETALSKLVALRRSVLSEAFTGRLVTQHPDDEPASVLLDRIAASRHTKPVRGKKS